MTLNGTLEDFSPAGILRVLSSDARTGAVRFDGTGCTVYMDGGQLYFAGDEGTDEALATALVRPGRLSPEDWARTVQEAGDRATVAELLVRHDLIDSALLASVVLSIMLDPLISLFHAGEGDFEFEPEATHWLGPYRTFRVDVLVAEVRRRVREADEWAHVMPSLDVWVHTHRSLPEGQTQVTLLREDWELITTLSGPRSIDELATALGCGRYTAARVVYRLHETGLVDITANRPGAVVVPLRPSAVPIKPDLVPIKPDVVHIKPDLDQDHGPQAPPSPLPASPSFELDFAPVDAPRRSIERIRENAASLSTRRGSAVSREHNAAWLDEMYAQHAEEIRAREARRQRDEESARQLALVGHVEDQSKKVGRLRRFFSASKDR